MKYRDVHLIPSPHFPYCLMLLSGAEKMVTRDYRTEFSSSVDAAYDYQLFEWDWVSLSNDQKHCKELQLRVLLTGTFLRFHRDALHMAIATIATWPGFPRTCWHAAKSPVIAIGARSSFLHLMISESLLVTSLRFDTILKVPKICNDILNGR